MRHYSSSLHGEEDDDPLIHHQQQQETHHQIWDPEAAQVDALLDDSIFYTGGGADFPPLLPDFPCMSSSSSSSSTPAPLKTTATMSCSSSSSASSSAASWAALRSDADHDNSRSYYNKDHQVVNHQIEIEMASNNNDNNDSNCCYDYHHLNNNNTDLQVDTPSGGGALSSTASMEVAHHAAAPPPPSEQGVDCCMDVMDELGYMDLLDTNDFFDPSSIFQGDHQNLLLLPDDFQPQHPDHEQQGMMTMMMTTDNDNPNNNNNGDETTTTAAATQLLQSAAEGAEEEEEDLGSVFLEWLKNNKENVSAEDLRRVKIKKSTIDSAARRLGGGREAMKQLVKLVLEWVQTNHLQRRTTTAAAADVSASSDPVPPPPSYTNQQVYQLVQEPSPDPNPIQGPWVGPPVPQYPDLAAGVSVGYPPNIGYGAGDPFARRTGSNFGAYPAADYNQVIEPAPSWPGSQFAMFPAAESQLGSGQLHAFPGYPYLPAQQMGLGGGDNSNTLVRMGSSATKEARKKRMARQRRFLSHHHRNHHHHQSQHQAAGGGQHHGGFVEHQVGATSQQQQHQQGNLVYWPPAHQGSSGLVAAASGPAPADGSAVQNADRPAMQNQNTQRQGGGASEKRQGWKPEKNLRFLLQKVLKQSDVGNLGRIVLPKKEAETHLPELEARDGISIAMEDIVTSRVWNMRYRFWPNNKSRMYLLENTGDFVRANGLQEGDFIVIYSDLKCGKYLIRGVKVRQSGFKPESKKATGKSQKNGHANSPSQAAAAAAAANALPMDQS
ncbi:unnamed protein product [Linum trigynum]|uniref:TF-B3 domain-containing protein n=1 Tax=Linum trigynum TaxID=586398 RepID=A0AAV2CYG0_9ROSI